MYRKELTNHACTKADASEAGNCVARETILLLRKNDLTPDTAIVEINETDEEEYENSISKK